MTVTIGMIKAMPIISRTEPTIINKTCQIVLNLIFGGTSAQSLRRVSALIGDLYIWVQNYLTVIFVDGAKECARYQNK